MSFFPQYSNLLENNHFPLFLVTCGFIKQYYSLPSFECSEKAISMPPPFSLFTETIPRELLCQPFQSKRIYQFNVKTTIHNYCILDAYQHVLCTDGEFYLPEMQIDETIGRISEQIASFYTYSVRGKHSLLPFFQQSFERLFHCPLL